MNQLRNRLPRTWERTPLIVPRSLTGVSYVMLGVVGIAMAVTESIGPSTGSLAATLGPWGVWIALSALVGLLLLLGARWVPALLEAAAATALFSLMSVYIVASWTELISGDWDAIRRTALVLAAAGVPLFRAAELVNVWVGRRHVKADRG